MGGLLGVCPDLLGCQLALEVALVLLKVVQQPPICVHDLASRVVVPAGTYNQSLPEKVILLFSHVDAMAVAQAQLYVCLRHCLLLVHARAGVYGVRVTQTLSMNGSFQIP